MSCVRHHLNFQFSIADASRKHAREMQSGSTVPPCSWRRSPHRVVPLSTCSQRAKAGPWGAREKEAANQWLGFASPSVRSATDAESLPGFLSFVTISCFIKMVSSFILPIDDGRTE